jgi:hypothetical protein
LHVSTSRAGDATVDDTDRSTPLARLLNAQAGPGPDATRDARPDAPTQAAPAPATRQMLPPAAPSMTPLQLLATV